MPTLAAQFRRLRRWFALASWASIGTACAGTPTPEPPDHLPRPDPGPFREIAVDAWAATLPAPFLVPLDARPGTVQGDTDLWIVNLDDPDNEPITLRANDDGSFATDIVGRPGERVRLVSRTTTRHSLPLDLIVAGSSVAEAFLARSTGGVVPCLAIEPPEEIAAAVSAGSALTRRFALQNDCDEPVMITGLGLRLGDQGFSLTDPPPEVPAGGRAEIAVRFEGHSSRSEQTDIVLLNVVAGSMGGRYALGVWSSSSR